jgi:hypothetical protein
MKSPLPEVPYGFFKEFIAPGTDRFAFLNALLDKLNLRSSALTLSGNRHFMISPSPEGPGPSFRTALHGGAAPLVLVAHYDRAADSPGANDNSAAVFILIETAIKLREKKARDWIIIFTDKEELSRDEGITRQGSYTLAAGLRHAGLGGGRFFIFDACGTGDTLIISTTADHLIKNENGPGIIKTKQAVQQLEPWPWKPPGIFKWTRSCFCRPPFPMTRAFYGRGFPPRPSRSSPEKKRAPLFPFYGANPALPRP